MIESMIGPIAGILGVSGFGYQLYKMIRTRETKAMSYNLSIFVGISIAMWAGYGFEQNDPVIYVPNLVLLIILAGMFGYKMRMERIKIPL
jgi:uncharacterized protein with PQ loop repeat